MADRVSQETVEVVYTTTGAKARVSQEVAEALIQAGAAKPVVSQVAVEVLARYPLVATRLSQVAVEVLGRIPTRRDVTAVTENDVAQPVKASKVVRIDPALETGSAQNMYVATGEVAYPSAGRILIDAPDAELVPVKPTAAAFTIAGQPPTVPVVTAPAALKIVGLEPQVSGAVKPPAGVLKIVGFTPKGPPVTTKPEAGKLTIIGFEPRLLGGPARPPAGRLILAAFPARDVNLTQTTAARIVMVGLPAEVPVFQAPAPAGIILNGLDAETHTATVFGLTRGLLRIGTFPPTVTDLSEPPTPGGGEGSIGIRTSV